MSVRTIGVGHVSEVCRTRLGGVSEVCRRCVGGVSEVCRRCVRHVSDTWQLFQCGGRPERSKDARHCLASSMATIGLPKCSVRSTAFSRITRSSQFSARESFSSRHEVPSGRCHIRASGTSPMENFESELVGDGETLSQNRELRRFPGSNTAGDLADLLETVKLQEACSN
jgi:hypothetical protein